ncbi:MAG: hypothetical protein ACC661_05160, partial [Verrucomicrobiales bacterium]
PPPPPSENTSGEDPEPRMTNPAEAVAALPPAGAPPMASGAATPAAGAETDLLDPDEVSIGLDGGASGPLDTPSPPSASLLEAPVAALEDFLSADGWQARLGYVLHPDVVGPRMENYAQTRADGPVPFTSIRFQHTETDPDSSNRFFVFHVTTGDEDPGFPVLIEETGDGLKVDWESFVEFKDGLFSAFTTAPGPGKTARFHLIMRNAHYFGGAFPELEDLAPFRLDPPMPDQEIIGFARRDSPVFEQIKEYVSWGMDFTPYVEVRWTKSESGRDYLEIIRLLHPNWRNRPS